VRQSLILLVLLTSTSIFATPRRRAVSAPGTLSLLPAPATFGAFVAAPDGTVWIAGRDVALLDDDGSTTLIAQNVNCGDAAFFDSAALLCSTPQGFTRVERSGAVTVVDPRSGLLAQGPDGTIAFSSGRAIGRIARDEFVLPASLGNPYAMTVALDGAIWFTSGRDVVRITSESDYTVFHDDSLFAGREPGTGFSEILADPDGTIWLLIPRERRTSGFTRLGAIVSLTPDGSFHEEAVLRSPLELRQSPDGSLWMLDVVGPGFLAPRDARLMHFVPGRGATAVNVPGLGGFNDAIAFTVDTRGRVWLEYAGLFSGLVIRN
jgi:streptogramin lyase